MIAVIGLSHKTATIDVRERLALSAESSDELLDELVGQGAIGEALVVSTCNRVEIVAAARDEQSGPEQVVEAVHTVLGARAPGIEKYLYAHTGNDAVRHLFRVASSLDSLVMGEPQILGQVKMAYDKARKRGTVAGNLNRVVSHALRAAKRVRTETTLGAGQVSVPSVAMDLARQIFGKLEGHRALLIGSGQMGEAAAKLLTAAGASLGVVGRNRARVAELAAKMNGEPYGFEDLPAQLATVDVIITTTSSPHYVVTKEQVAAVRKKRRGRSLFLIDLAVPRDVDPAVDELDSVFLYNVDDLSQIVSETLSSRQREAEAAEGIVELETKNFERALYAEQATPTIVALRSQLGGILEGELSKSLRLRLKHLSVDDRDALNKMLESALNKMLHPATRHLRGLAADTQAQADLDNCVAVLQDLFAIELSGDAPSLRSGNPAAQPAQGTPETSRGPTEARSVEGASPQDQGTPAGSQVAGSGATAADPNEGQPGLSTG